MPDPAAGGFTLLAGLSRIAGKLIPPLFRGQKLADGEIAELAKQLNALLSNSTEASVQAQLATRGSPNDEGPQKALVEAIRLSTTACQEFSCLFDGESIAPQNARVLAARIRFRELVTDEGNLDLMDQQQRLLRCADIEAATAEFHAAVRDESFKRWGIGLGNKAGKLRGRALPK